jgi:D-glycero-alpha-D-manno-heptose 1-phosphate guanylyltransferase
MFEAVILAGGMGTRLKSITGELPKPMVDVCGIPFLYRLMKRLESQGCSRIVLSLCYRSDFIIHQVTKDIPVECPVDFAVEEYPLDTGGAIKLASRFITSNQFIVLNGDTYCDVDYNALADFSIQQGLVICGVYVDDVTRYGTLNIDNNNNVLSMSEKTSIGYGLINSGIYVVTTSEIINHQQVKFSFEKDFIQTYQGQVKAFVIEGYFVDIGIPEDYQKFCNIIK